MKIAILISLLVTTIDSEKQKDDFGDKDVFRSQPAIYGHRGFYRQSLVGYLHEANMFEMSAAYLEGIIDRFGVFFWSDDQLRFLTSSVNPYVFTRHFSDGFAIRGPLYSLHVKVAKRLNLR